jgi:hypothetical protein
VPRKKAGSVQGLAINLGASSDGYEKGGGAQLR